MKRTFLLVLLTLLTAGVLWGQVEIINETLRDGSAPVGWTYFDITWQTGAGGYAWFTSIDSWIETPPIDLTDYSNVELTFDVAKYGTGTDGPLTVEIVVDGVIEQTFDSPIPGDSNYLTSGPTAITVTGDNVVIRWIRENSPSGKRLRDIILTGELTGAVATPTFNPPGGEFYPEVDVEILCATEGSTIYYSLAGDTGPWTEYTAPLNITETATIWAYAAATGYTDSIIASATYTIPAPQYTTLPYEETFDTDLGDCYVYSVSGPEHWIWSTYQAAYMNGYGSSVLEEDWLILPGIDFDQYDEVFMNFDTAYNYGSDDDNNYLKLLYSNDYTGIGDPSSATWDEIPFTQPSSDNFTWTFSGNLDLSSLEGTVWFGFKYHYEPGNYRAWEVDNINISETLTPMLSVSPDILSNFMYIEGEGPSDSQSYELSGDNLEPDSGEITVTSNLYFEVSIDDMNFVESLNVSYTNGELQNTSVYVRLKADLDIGDYTDETISNTGGGDSVDVTVNGSVTAQPEPGYFVDFEGQGETKTSYASGTVNLSGLNWDMTEALIGTLDADWKNGQRSARFRGYAASSMTMLENKINGIGTVSFYYRRYGTDPQVDWKVEYSTDDGTNWTQIGNVFTAPDTDEVQTFSEVVNIPGDIRIRIKRATEEGSSNNRLNIDDIMMTDFVDTNIVATPTFTPSSGTYLEPIDVTISTVTEGATVYYSFSNDPYSWVEFTTPIAVEETTTIWAYASAPDMEDSSINSATYIFPAPAMTDLPYTETFDTDLGDCYNYTVSGDNPWYHWSSSATCNAYQGSFPEEHWLVLPGINFDEYSNVLMSFTNYAQYGSIDENNYLKLFYSSNYFGIGDPYANGVTWTELTFNQPPEGTVGTTEIETQSGNIDLGDLTGDTVFLAFKYYSDGDPSRWRVDDINIFSGPALTVIPTTLSGFSYIEGHGPSAAQTFTVSGTNLTSSRDNITITGSENFEISLDDTNYSSLLEIPFLAGELDETDIYVRLVSGLETGLYVDELINVSGGGAESVTVTVNGEVLALPAGLPYAKNFTDFVFEQNTEILNYGDNNEWNFQSTGSADTRLQYLGNWGSGTSAGFRGNANVLGYQHTSTTGTFTASLNLINDYGYTLNQLYISYKGMVERTGEGRSPEWTVTVNGDEVPELSYSTSEGVNATKSITLTGLDVSPGGIINITWASERGEPSGASKQIGIGNLQVAEAEFVLPPTFDPPGEIVFTDDIEVELSTVTEDAIIYYSYIPSPYNWQEYTEPLVFDVTTTIWAKATKEGLTDSSILSETYTFYYESTAGMEGEYLWNELTSITSVDQIDYPYDTARFYMHGYIDNINNQVRCIYTGEWVNHPYGELSTPENFSAEHIYAQSWYESDLSPEEISFAVSDLHALHPARLDVNSARSNRAFDFVTGIDSIWGSGNYLSYVGANSDGIPVFDVADEFKGNLARAILYFGVRYYQNNDNFVRGFQLLPENLVDQLPILLQWHSEDPVDTREIERNQLVYDYQGNRNPFIDRPEFVELIWGEIGLDTPVAFSASDIERESFTANWLPVTGADSYRLDVSTSENFVGYLDGYKNLVVNNTSLEITDLTPGTNYYYRVRAVALDGTVSMNSDTIFVITGGELLYYWNFNENIPESGQNWIQPIPANISNAEITYSFTEAISYAGTTLNGIENEEAGGSFVPRPASDLINNGEHFDLHISTHGYQNLLITYATRGTTTGFLTQQILYSIDGTDFTEFATFTVTGEFDWEVRFLDFTDIPGVDNNSDFTVRFILDGGSGSTGNNRFDNIRVIGQEIFDILPTPQNVDIVITNNNVVITWDSVTGAASYRIEASNNPYSGFIDVTDQGILDGTSWSGSVSEPMRFYRVIAVSTPPIRR